MGRQGTAAQRGGRGTPEEVKSDEGEQYQNAAGIPRASRNTRQTEATAEQNSSLIFKKHGAGGQNTKKSELGTQGGPGKAYAGGLKTKTETLSRDRRTETREGKHRRGGEPAQDRAGQRRERPQRVDHGLRTRSERVEASERAG